MTTAEVEMRCVVRGGSGRLFGKALLRDGIPTISDNLIQFACKDCIRYQPDDVHRVLHNYSLDGKLVSTTLAMRDETTRSL